MQFPFADHVVEHIRVHAGRIDHAAGLVSFPAGHQPVALLRFFHLLHFRIEDKFHAVDAGIFRQGDGKPKGADNAS